jgi:hypothetical protein
MNNEHVNQEVIGDYLLTKDYATYLIYHGNNNKY